MPSSPSKLKRRLHEQHPSNIPSMVGQHSPVRPNFLQSGFAMHAEFPPPEDDEVEDEDGETFGAGAGAVGVWIGDTCGEYFD